MDIFFGTSLGYNFVHKFVHTLWGVMWLLVENKDIVRSSDINY